MILTLKGHNLDLLIGIVALYYFNIILYKKWMAKSKRFSHTQMATVCSKLCALKNENMISFTVLTKERGADIQIQEG